MKTTWAYYWVALFVATQGGGAATGGNTDFGDAPDGPYPTLLSSNGARHRITDLFLGQRVDSEADGQPNLNARRDDLSNGLNDEDGVHFGPLVSGELATVTIISSGKGFINAWIDFNRDGIWGPQEKILSQQAVSAGSNTFAIPLPGKLPSRFYFARFRLSRKAMLSPVGPAAEGEVEDYRIFIKGSDRPGPDLSLVITNRKPMLRWAVSNAVLQVAPDLSGPWTEISRTPEPWPVECEETHQFYRLLLLRPYCSQLLGNDWVWSEAAGACIRRESGTWLWQGFRHQWVETSHRFRDIHSELDNISYDFHPLTGRSLLTGKLCGHQQVGTCEDELEFRCRKKGIKTAVAEFAHGTLGPVVVEGGVDEYVEETFSRQIPLGDLAKYGDNVTLFMRGFRFSEIGSDEDGGTGAYPLRGFGLKVSHLQVNNDKLELDLTVMLHLAPKPFNTNPTPNPWKYSVVYQYTLVGGEEDEFTFATGHADYHGPHINADSGECPNASATDRQFVIEGEGKQRYNEGVVVFRGFFIKINNTGNTSGISGIPAIYLGRLVRAVEVSITGQSYDWSTGEATVTQNLYFCNHSVAQHAINTYYHGFYTLLQFNDPDQWAETNLSNDAGGGRDLATTTTWPYYYATDLESASFMTP